MDILKESKQSTATKIKTEKEYGIIAYSDDESFADGIVELFKEVLKLSHKQSFELMEKIHNEGSYIIYRESLSKCQEKLRHLIENKQYVSEKCIQKARELEWSNPERFNIYKAKFKIEII